MALKHLRTYRAILLIRREGSIRKAAEILAVSPSALNRAVLAIEEDFGIEVFDRLPGGVAPSIAGELLFRHLDEHLSHMDDFVSLIAEMRGGTAGRLRLTISNDLTGLLMQEVLDGFRAAYPGISVEARECDTLSALVSRDADIALLTRSVSEPACQVAASIQARVIGRVAPNHPSAGRALSLSEISDHALIMPQGGTGLGDMIDAALRRSRIQPKARHVWPNPMLALSMREPPDLVPTLSLGKDPDRHLGSVDLASLRIPPVVVSAFTRKDGRLPRAAELFLAHFQREL